MKKDPQPTAAKPQIVVITPTKNEGAIIARFLACCSLFADRIVLLDQASTDETVAIASRFPKVEIHNNPEKKFNEPERQKRLLELARESKATRLIILALDTDEIPTASILTSPEWVSFLNAAPGTVLRLPKLEILPYFQNVLLRGSHSFGYVDDGADHVGRFIHSERVPIPSIRTELVASQIKILHYSLVRPELQAAKNRFYCVRENLKASRSLMERRTFYRSDFIEHSLRTMKNEIFDRNWIAPYEALGIDMTSVPVEYPNWFDQETEAEIRKLGAVRFHFDPVWNRGYPELGGEGKLLLPPPKGLTSGLAVLDRLYANLPCKRAFASIVELLYRTYVATRQ